MGFSERCELHNHRLSIFCISRKLHWIWKVQDRQHTVENLRKDGLAGGVCNGSGFHHR